MINNRVKEINYEKEKTIAETLGFIQGRVSRSMQNYNPYNNYQLYPNDIGRFYFNYPYTVPFYRPIKYFYQRPVQLNENTAFIEQREQLHQTIKHNKKVYDSNSKAVKWGKPMKLEEVIKQAEEIHHPIAKYISPLEFRKKQKELEQLRYEYESVDPERKKKIRNNNQKVWNTVKKLRYITSFFNILRQFTKSSINLRSYSDVLSQSSKANMNELSFFMLSNIKSVEDYATENFKQIFVYDVNMLSKTEDSVFKIKSFFHQLFYDLTTGISTKEDIPKNIQNIILNYISDRKYLPDNFLTTFEFNRLEFDLDLKLNKMSTDRQAMMICFILLYRVLILEIFKNYSKYFKWLENSNNEIIQYNVSFIIIVFHHILKDAFAINPKIYREHFKDSHLFKRFVIDGSTFDSINLIESKLKNDEIEFSNFLPQLPKAKEFVKDNYRWINMYKMNAYSFCINFIEKLMV
jgi:hypothetical protein